MIANLNFFLPEDKDEFILATNGYGYWAALTDIMSHLRAQLKYNDKLSEGEYKIIESIQEECCIILDSYHINLDEVN
jgi:hypothetical protein